MHGAQVLKEAGLSDPGLSFFGLGGDLMRENGCELVAHLRDTAVMGFTEAIGSLFRVLGVLRKLKKAIAREKPAAALLIDSPDLNFPLAKACHAMGVPVLYYVCPQVWAWRERRIETLRKYATRRALIFPFEEAYYRKRGVSCDLVGHPLFDEIRPAPRASLREALGLDPASPALAILPGSRPGVFRHLAPAVFGAADLLLQRVPGLRPTLALSPIIGDQDLGDALAPYPRLRGRLTILRRGSREILGASDAAILASGTSVLEAAILDTPMVVAYKVSKLSWLLARALVRVPFAAAANLLLGRRAIPEYLQDDCVPENLANAAAPLLVPGPPRALALHELSKVRKALGGPGASRKALGILEEIIGKGKDPKDNPENAPALGGAPATNDASPKGASEAASGRP
jgi:lipid-A-disaccharide synthase